MNTASPGFAPLSFASRQSVRTAQPRLALAELQAAIQDAADRPLSAAVTLPAQAYTSEEFFDWEVAHLLRAEWQCVAHGSQIPQPGDFVNLDLLGEPLTVVRGGDGTARVLSRVCPHRGMDVMPASVEASLVEFHLEDMEVCTGVQRGLYASGWQPGRLSHLEMPIWLFHRYLAARLRGVWPTDDRTPANSQRP